MKILITGGNGMLARTLNSVLNNYEIISATKQDIDISCDNSVNKIIEIKPDVIINCAAFTKVDNCEIERDIAYSVNAIGCLNIAKACKEINSRLISISTDYVFSGNLNIDKNYKEDDLTNPKTIYGDTKLKGENFIQETLSNYVILRIAWLYGFGGPSFLHTMTKLHNQNISQIKVVNDQYGNPTSTTVVAKEIDFILKHPEINGIIHGTCCDKCTWCDLAVEFFKILNIDQNVIPCTSDKYPSLAKRPRNSSLENTILNKYGYINPNWKDALKIFVNEEFINENNTIKIRRFENYRT